MVVQAESHNPSVLHPVFLSSQNIVPTGWELSEAPVCTPAVSIIRYQNRISVLMEQGRLQVLDEMPSSETPIPAIATGILRALPHVRYRAVGLNFGSILVCADGSDCLKQRFLRDGPWEREPAPLSAVGYRFVYLMEGAKLRLTLDPGSARFPDGRNEIEGILVNANYHMPVSEQTALDDSLAAISRAEECRNHFLNTVRIHFEIER